MSIAAVALGACAIEKHLTLDRDLPGPDHRASLEPAELTALVTAIRTAEAALGDGVKQPASAEQGNREVVRRSIVAAEPIAAGSPLTPEALTALRPGTGIPPTRQHELIGRAATRDIAAGEQIDWSDVA